MFKVGEIVTADGYRLMCNSVTEDCNGNVDASFRKVGRTPPKKETKFKVGDKVTGIVSANYIYTVIGTGSHKNTNWYILASDDNDEICHVKEHAIKTIKEEPKLGLATYIGEKGVVRERTDIYDEEIISGTCVDYKYSTTDGFLLYIQNDEKEVYFVKPEHFILKSSKKMYDLYQELLEKCDKLTDASIHYMNVIGNLQNQLCKTSDYIKQEELTTKIKEFKKKQAKTWDKKDFIKRYMRRIEIITNMKGNK